MTEQLSLKKDGVEMVDYPRSLQDKVQQSAEAWSAFVELPQEIKDIFEASSLQSGVGYEKKGNGERESNDIKENFDITKAGLVDFKSKASDNLIVQTFIDAAETLFTGLENMIKDFGDHVEHAYGVEGFSAHAAASADKVFVRYITYPPTPVGTLLGEPHVDHSGYTFHLYESSDGCERLTFDKKSWVPMPVVVGKAAVFCSMQLQLESHNQLKGLCHRIIANRKTARVGRNVITGFIPLAYAPAYDRTTHGRLQDKEPGFNYDMDLQDFAKLFKQT